MKSAQKSKWNTNEFLGDVIQSAAKKDFKRMEQALKAAPSPDNLEAALEDINEDMLRRLAEQARRRRSLNQGILYALVIVIVVAAGFMAVQFFGDDIRALANLAVAMATPPPTITPQPTFTPAPTDTPTPEPTATFTPVPVDETINQVDLASIYPPAPLKAEMGWVLNAEQAAAEPAFNDAGVWQVGYYAGEQSGGEAYYFTNVGNAAVTFEMDVNQGWYALYLVDTLENSDMQGLPFTWTAALNGQEVVPLYGTNEARFGAAADPEVLGQHADEWLMLGVIEAEQNDRVSVRIQIPQLPEGASFSVAKLLIVRIREQEQNMLNSLGRDGISKTRPLVSLLDNENVKMYEVTGASVRDEKDDQGRVVNFHIDGGSRAASLNPLDRYSDSTSWNGEMAVRSEATADWQVEVFIDWQPVGRLPAGRYELLVWVPENHASSFVKYILLSPIAEAVMPASNSVGILPQDQHPGEWVSVGEFDVTTEGPLGVRMMLQRTNAENTGLEVGIDAVALVRVNP